MSALQSVHFWKMHGLGNDFMLIDARQQCINPDFLPVSAWADRHTGVGFDQLLLLLPSKNADVFCRIYNSDGSEAEQCGNGMRCVAFYLSDLSDSDIFTIETLSGIVKAKCHLHSQIEIAMDMPQLHPGWVSVPVSQTDFLKVFALSLGNPHAILRVDQLNNFQVTEVAKKIAAAPDFPQGVNVGVMQILDKQTLKLRTFERGAGETLACGSNACAAAVTGILHHNMTSPVSVRLPLGELKIIFDKEWGILKMRGKAALVFKGDIKIS